VEPLGIWKCDGGVGSDNDGMGGVESKGEVEHNTAIIASDRAVEVGCQNLARIHIDVTYSRQTKQRDC
jgi:hypothetical protein